MRSFKRLMFETGLSTGFGEFPDLSRSRSIIKLHLTSKNITMAFNVSEAALVLLFSHSVLQQRNESPFVNMFRGLLHDTNKVDGIRRMWFITYMSGPYVKKLHKVWVIIRGAGINVCLFVFFLGFGDSKWKNLEAIPIRDTHTHFFLQTIGGAIMDNLYFHYYLTNSGTWKDTGLYFVSAMSKTWYV